MCWRKGGGGSVPFLSGVFLRGALLVTASLLVYIEHDFRYPDVCAETLPAYCSVCYEV
jgi:hypothetical protein